MRTRAILSVMGCLLAALPLQAGNGHLLHGVGAVNSSLGGVSTALPTDVIGALHFNPALLVELEGNQVGFSAEIFSDQPKATATFADSTFRPEGSYTTEGETELGVLPAIGFSHPFKKRPAALGLGLLAVAGFRTDWPQDPNNPIFAPQPNGFGTVKTNLAITKIPVSYAWKASEALSLGVSLAIYQGSLAISPLPPATPDCTLPDPASGRVADCFFVDADNTTTSYAVALQVGLYYKLGPKWAVGASYTTPQDFDDYQWESAVALPYLRDVLGNVTPNPDLGSRRVVEYPLDGPAVLSLGLGYDAGGKWRVGVDARWVGYSSVDGAGGVGGFRPDRGLNEIGWDDILIGAIGAEYQASEELTWRFGFNYSETPIQEEVVFTSLGTPPTFEDHYTVGLGYQINDKVRVDVGAYWAPERSVTGPLLNPFLVDVPETLDQQLIEGGTFTIEESILSGLFGLSYRF